MFERIANFFSKNKIRPVFDEKYRNGYKNLWINHLCDYSP